MKTKIIVAAFLSVLSITSLCQQTDSVSGGNVWTLKQCVEYAMANNLSVKRSNYNVASSELDYKQSQWAMFPNLNANINYGYNWGRSVNPVTYEFTTQQLNSLSPSASSSVTLF